MPAPIMAAISDISGDHDEHDESRRSQLCWRAVGLDGTRTEGIKLYLTRGNSPYPLPLKTRKI
jgi:hypothetical protein